MRTVQFPLGQTPDYVVVAHEADPYPSSCAVQGVTPVRDLHGRQQVGVIHWMLIFLWICLFLTGGERCRSSGNVARAFRWLNRNDPGAVHRGHIASVSIHVRSNLFGEVDDTVSKSSNDNKR